LKLHKENTWLSKIKDVTCIESVSFCRFIGFGIVIGDDFSNHSEILKNQNDFHKFNNFYISFPLELYAYSFLTIIYIWEMETCTYKTYSIMCSLLLVSCFLSFFTFCLLNLFYNVLFSVSCFLLLFTFCLFAFYPIFCFILPEIKVNELRKKQEICSKKYNCR